MRRITRSLCATALASGFSLQATASHPQTQPPVSELDYLGELPIVLSVSRLDQPKQEAPVATTVIDRGMIEASGAQDIASLLALVPGFQVSMIDGVTRSVTSHGFADQYSRRMQVMVDGRPIYSPSAGGVFWQSLPIALEDVERIEVVRGPNAASYGSNAFLGVINISTRKPAAMPPLEFNVSAGSLNTRNTYIGTGLQQGDHRLRLGIKLEENAGFPDRHDDSQSLSLNLRGDYRLSAADSLEYQAGFRTTDLGAGFAGDPVQPPRPTDAGSNFQQLVWTRLMDDGSDVRVQYYHNAESLADSFTLRASEIDSSLPPISLATGLSSTSHRHDLELQHRFPLAQDLRMVWGGGLRHDQANAPFLLEDGPITRSQAHLFVNGEWHATRELILHGNLMGEYLEHSGSYFSPRIAANYLFASNSAIRVSASRAYRFPALFEQFAHYAFYLERNPDIEALLFYDAASDIRPEKIDAYEIGLVQQVPRYKLNLDLKLFTHRVSDAIVTTNQTYSGAESVFRFRNGGAYRVNGIELGASYEPTRRTRINLALALADADGYRIREEDETGELLADSSENVPEQTLSLLISHRFQGNIEASAWLQYTGRTVWEGDGGVVPAHERLDVRLAKHWNIGGSKLSLSLVAQNLLDDDYYEFYQDKNTFERRIYGQIAIISK